MPSRFPVAPLHLHASEAVTNTSNSLQRTHIDFAALQKSPSDSHPHHSSSLYGHSPLQHLAMPATNGNTTEPAAPMEHQRGQQYHWKLPSPPRILVPPPAMVTDMPALSLGDNLAHASKGGTDLQFLKELDLSAVLDDGNMVSWSYDRRREAQLILPWLYLGPLNAAKDEKFLRREEITMVLSIRNRPNAMSGAMRTAQQFCQEVAAIDAADPQTLIQNFPRATQMINEHVAKIQKLTTGTPQACLGHVLVFCETGNERSAAVVAAYLMETMEGLDHIKAMQVCQAQRFCINFDENMKNILQSYWEILEAKRSVAAQNAQTEPWRSTTASPATPWTYLQAPQRNTKQKRRMEVDDMEDVDMKDAMDHDDALRFEGRANTPFRDA